MDGPLSLLQSLQDGGLGFKLRYSIQKIRIKLGISSIEENKCLDQQRQWWKESGRFQIGPEKIAAYKFASITSVDVERSFATYKRILDDRSHNLLDINIKMVIIVNLNKFSDW